ncbi:hypothetical protein GpartN1_g2482.t1 [Galdieria partita]|uniref:Uncharacterized protein n=1 Tax=Galdieria partita TaxID=83374 RepID=A0A9C7UPK5_9RHOD|nr:hypothetical protein GpartN1_g2482.t1 [Galdieria partita]
MVVAMSIEESSTTYAQLRFRNYVSKDEELKKVLRKFVDPDEIVLKVTKEQADDAQQEIKEFESKRKDNVSLLIPQVSNLDLKRKVERKLEALEKRTQDSVLSIVREKLKQEEENTKSETEDANSKDLRSGVALWRAVHSIESSHLDEERWD